MGDADDCWSPSDWSFSGRWSSANQCIDARAGIRASGADVPHYKLCFVGDPAVGKTTLIMQLLRAFDHDDRLHAEGHTPHPLFAHRDWDYATYTPTIFDQTCMEASMQTLQNLTRPAGALARAGAPRLARDGGDRPEKARYLHYAMWDTAGGEYYDRLMPLSYPYTNLFVLCFNVSNHVSLQQAKQKWWPELQHHWGEGPILLVGCKSDLRGVEDLPAVWDWSKCDGSTVKPREVTYEDAVATAVQMGAIGYVETSALAQHAQMRSFRRKDNDSDGDEYTLSSDDEAKVDDSSATGSTQRSHHGMDVLLHEIFAFSLLPARKKRGKDGRRACVLQ